jgi:hypothetical protein
MNRIKVVEKPMIYKFGSVHFWYMIHPKKLQNLQKKKKSPKFSCGPKLEAFTVGLHFLFQKSLIENEIKNPLK